MEKEQLKFEDRTRLGIFMGYHMNSGLKWSHDYWILDAEQFTNSGDGQRCHLQRVQEIVVPPRVVFPIKSGDLIQNAGGSPLELERSRRRAETPLEFEADSNESGPGSDSSDAGLGASDSSGDEKGDTDESANAGGLPSSSSQRDYWRTQGDYVIRVHVQPRTSMFIPTDAIDPPRSMLVSSIARVKPLPGST
jgi:hypothetical protein